MVKKKKTDVTEETIIISPAMAAKWLETKAPNRNIIDAVVATYAAMMNQGLWILTPQGIIFDCDGMLIDGQHRLWAIVESGRSVPMRVSRGWNRNVQLVLDIVTVRSASQNIQLTRGTSGFPTGSDVAVFRAMVRGLGQCISLPVPVVEAHICEYQESIEFATEALGGRSAPPAIAQLKIVLARAWHTESHEKLRRFCWCILEARAEKVSDRAAIILRDLIMGPWRSPVQKPTIRARYGKVQAALRSFLSGRSAKSIRAVDTDIYPIPESVGLNAWRQRVMAAATARVTRKGRSSRGRATTATDISTDKFIIAMLKAINGEKLQRSAIIEVAGRKGITKEAVSKSLLRMTSSGTLSRSRVREGGKLSFSWYQLVR